MAQGLKKFTPFLLCFQFLRQVSVYYFVKRRGKQHQHHFNDVAHIVDLFW